MYVFGVARQSDAQTCLSGALTLTVGVVRPAHGNGNNRGRQVVGANRDARRTGFSYSDMIFAASKSVFYQKIETFR